MEEDVEILLPVKFRWTPFSDFREEVKNVSANQRSRWPSCFSDRPEKTQIWYMTLRSCFLTSFFELHSTVAEEKSKMFFPIRGQGGHLFPDRPEKYKLGRRGRTGLWLTKTFLLLWNCWTKFYETCQEARSQRPLPSLCFTGLIGKTGRPPRPLIDWDIFDFSSDIAVRNSTKLVRKQDLNVLYLVCVFRADRKKKQQDDHPASDWLRHFRLFLSHRWTEFNETCQEAILFFFFRSAWKIQAR